MGNNNQAIGSPIDPAEFARKAEKSYSLNLTNIDYDSGFGIITDTMVENASRWSYRDCSVRVNLATGELSGLSEDFVKKHNAKKSAKNTHPSYSGKFVLENIEESENITVKTKGGSTVDTLRKSDFGDSMDIAWRPKSESFSIAVSGALKGKPSLIIYYPDKKERYTVSKNPVEWVTWSPDGRFIAGIRPMSPKNKKLFGYKSIARGSLIIFDAENSYKKIVSPAKSAGSLKFSESGSKLAYTELVKDEYGDYAKYSLVVLDIQSGKTQTILSNYREPNFIWSEDDALLVSACDKYAVPSISLVTIRDGKITPIASDCEAAILEPLAYLPKQKTAVYRTCENASGDGTYDLRLVKQGGRLLKLIPGKAEGSNHEQR